MEQYGGEEEGLIPEMKNYSRPADHFHLIHPHPLDIYADYHRQHYLVSNMLASSSSLSNCAAASAAAPAQNVVGGEATAIATARWPRQETLTLLEIRSNLDSNFKISNLKGPLWDQVSRIMASEHGYYRSGKKCREKFDNLYKYYKKTKDGKSGRQDGKHYRFFRQLESLYGETDHPPPLLETQYDQPFQFPQQNIINNQDFQAPKQPSEHNLTHNSNSSDFETSSYDDDNEDEDDDDEYRRHGSRLGWKAKIESFIDLQMKKLMEKQEEWLEKVMKTIERKEQERLLKEEEWRNQEVARIEKEHEFWAKERAWIEARDASIMDSFQKLVQRRDHAISIENEKNAKFDHHNSWPTSRLVSSRPASREPRCELFTGKEEFIWEGNAANYMSHLGYERSGQMWDSIISSKDPYYSKKHKENPRSDFGFSQMNEQAINQGENYSGISEQSEFPR
ncbi:trihelix transcription factor PTL-like [Impatiens glandulifera]|uniref:trihelix transcription factor PTL-like n=1 Tax=Impatiens glandulifera TaxID=253017 RepID=UPI001FB08E50|nr:trihelix transcription factor PTL-like [Impatiens glandulifera]